jgi:ribosome-associated toxin RatA of RatAB toxin-antitoxin module
VVVEVALGQIWNVVCDYERYPEFIPEMRSVRVLRREGPRQEVAFEIELELLGLKKRISYTLAMTESPQTSIQWSLVASDTLRGDDGRWLFKPLGERRTEATYEIELRLGPFIPRAVSSFLAEQSLPRLLSQFKRRAESLPGL